MRLEVEFLMSIRTPLAGLMNYFTFSAVLPLTTSIPLRASMPPSFKLRLSNLCLLPRQSARLHLYLIEYIPHHIFERCLILICHVCSHTCSGCSADAVSFLMSSITWRAGSVSAVCPFGRDLSVLQVNPQQFIQTLTSFNTAPGGVLALTSYLPSNNKWHLTYLHWHGCENVDWCALS